MALTPLQLNTAAGLLQNQGLNANTELVSALQSYSTLSFVQNIDGAIAIGSTANILSSSTLTTLKTLATAQCPALGDSAPTSNIVLVNSGFSGTVAFNANLYLGNGDLSKFAQTWAAAQGYVSQTNEFINASRQSQTYLGPTFGGMNELSTGGITNITTDPQTLGADLKKVGNLINLADLENWGTPMALVRQLVNLSGIVPPPLQVAFVTLGIDQNIAVNLDDPTITVTDQIQKTMFTAMLNIKETSLDQIKQILGVTTANLTCVADLLNPLKILPNSYQTLLTPTSVGFVPIYVNQSGSVNPILSKQLPGYALRSTDQGYEMTAVDRMTFMVGADLALADKAFAISLLQLNAVIEMTLPQLADTFIAVTPTDQPLVVAQTTPVPSTNASYFATGIAPGATGPGNTLVICDVIGTPTGINLTGGWLNTVSNLSGINTTDLANTYSVILNTVNGTYGNVYSGVSVPGYGNYVSADVAVSSALIPAAQANVTAIVSTHGPAVANLNSNWSVMGAQVQREQTLQSLSNINPSLAAANSPQSVMSFVSNLPSSGLDVLPGGERFYLRSVANTQILAGQSVIATMTEGANDVALRAVGLQSGSQIT